MQRPGQKFKNTMPPAKKEKVKMQNVKAQAKFEDTIIPEKKEKVKV